jgi:PAS domain S-box-containing protein
MNGDNAKATARDFISGDGQTVELLRSFNWSGTSLGNREQWPVHLRTMVNLCFNSPFPMMIAWGGDLIQIYNDAYSQIIAQKHPQAFGAKAKDVWAELWDFIGPQFDQVIQEGHSCWFDNQLILLNRYGYEEECYFTFSYSPIFNEQGAVDGILTIATETTETVINKRHFETLGNLSKAISGRGSVHAIYQAALEAFKNNTQDFPFAALYEVAPDASTATLFGACGVEIPHASLPQQMNFTDKDKIGSRNFVKCVLTNEPIAVHDIRSRLGDMPSGFWSIPPEETVLFPVTYPGKKIPFAVLVIGVNPHARLNQRYMSFFQLVSDQLATEVFNFFSIKEQETIIRKTKENDLKIQSYIEELLDSRKKTEENGERLRMAMESTNLGTWDFLPQSGELSWSEECKKIYDIPEDVKIDFATFTSLIHPDDKAFVEKEIQKSMAPDGSGNYDISYRILRYSDRSPRWIRAQGKVYLNAEKQPERFIGTVVDVTDQKKAQEELVRSEKLFRSIVLNIPNSLLIVIDKDCRFMALEGDITNRLGYNVTDYKGKHLSELIVPEQYESSKLLYERMLSGEKFSIDQSNSTGEDFVIHFIPLKDDQEQVYAGLVIAFDVTDTRKAEEKSAKLAAIVQTSNDAIISTTLDGVITSWNEAAQRMFGYTASEIIGQTILKLIPSDRMDEEVRIVKALLNSGTINHFETQRVTKDKHILDISLTVSLIKDPEGNVMGVSKIARNITEKKQAEKLIIENEARIRLATESAELGTWDIDLTNGRILSNTINHRIREFSDSGPMLDRKEFMTIVHADDRETVQKAFKKALMGGKLSFETRLLKKDGTHLWARVNGKTILNDRKRPIRLLGIITDITESKNFLIELEESERRFKTVADNAPVMIWTATPDKSCDFFNKAWLDFTGRSHEMEIGNGWAASVHPDDLQRCIDIYTSSFDARIQFNKEYRLKRHDGIYRWVVCQGVPRHASDGSFVGYIGSCMDIHESKMAKEELEELIQERTAELNNRNLELQQQKDFVETMLDASIDVMLVYDKEMRFRSFNKACELKYGLNRNEVLGKKLLDIYPFAAGSQGYQDLQKALAGETIHNPIYKSAVTNIYYEDFLIPLKNKDDEVHSVLVIMHDITKNIESAEQLKKTNADLVKSNRDLEQFAYIASHDLQEPLRKIQTFTNLLEHNIENEEARKRYFEKISSSAQRMSELIKAVLNYSRLTITREHFEEVDLNAIIEHVLVDFELVITEKQAKITYDHMPRLQGISLQLNQLFSNLISNSLKFSEKEPKIHISSKICQNSDIQDYPNLDHSREYVEIRFKDNGIGFEQQYVEQVFTIFQRLNDRERYEGTGIGLALCKKITDNHHGHIMAKSELGIGSEFYIYLPI